MFMLTSASGSSTTPAPAPSPDVSRIVPSGHSWILYVSCTLRSRPFSVAHTPRVTVPKGLTVFFSR